MDGGAIRLPTNDFHKGSYGPTTRGNTKYGVKYAGWLGGYVVVLIAHRRVQSLKPSFADNRPRRQYVKQGGHRQEREHGPLTGLTCIRAYQIGHALIPAISSNDRA